MNINVQSWFGSLVAALILLSGAGFHQSVVFPQDEKEGRLQVHTETSDFISLYNNLSGGLDERISSGSVNGHIPKPPRDYDLCGFISESVQAQRVSTEISDSENFLLSFDLRTLLFPFHYFW